MKASLSILVVDDDVDNASSLAELFELEGHQVEVVYTGEDAISSFGRRSFDLAFMDVMMPGMNGVESFLEIKKMRPAARVIMMTGYSVEQLLQQAIENGALGVIAKPMDPTKIMGLVNEVGPRGVLVAPAAQRDEAIRMCNSIVAAGRKCSVFGSRDEVIVRTPGLDEVIILDLHQPLIEGVGVYRDLRSSGICLPTIIVTDGETLSGDPLDILRDFRATGILNKPFDPDQLLSRLQALAA